MFGSYRKDEFADPESFLAQLGMVLERYSDDVITKSCHPVTGIQRVYRTPPSMAAIAEFCDDESKRLARIRELSTFRISRREPRPVDPTARANLLVHRDAPGYDKMVEWAKTVGAEWYRWDPQGIWVPLGVYQDRKNSHDLHGFRQFTVEELRAIYRMAE